MTTTPTYTAISFAPVQGFIEKSRKLRDLFGASLILSHLSACLVERAQELNFEVISPGLITVREGMPNRILIRGEQALNRDEVKKTLIKEWGQLLDWCRNWVETRVTRQEYYWSQHPEDKGKQKGEWERWQYYTWEVFWGYGHTVEKAMDDLETRKLKRDWIGINWVGESSSLSGTDAIAWHELGKESERPWEVTDRKYGIDEFYLELAQATENKPLSGNPVGNFLDPNERLSIPELVKRLITLYGKAKNSQNDDELGSDFHFDSLAEMVRFPQPNQPGHWTGWFMGDGDEVGKKLKELVQDPDNIQPLRDFSHAMRRWGEDFKATFPEDLGRVIYAGGDDFLGVFYSKNPQVPIPKKQVLKWLMGLDQQWQRHGQDITVSVGFVWAGHSVPQREVLQHCRDAEKRAKNLGRNRVTIRVLFNSGQYVQWTCPWQHLKILSEYRDRDGINTQEEAAKGSERMANWTHIYNDWAALKARHAVRLKEMEGLAINKQVALALFDLYFDYAGQHFEDERLWDDLTGDNSAMAIVNWIDDLIHVGWQLCRNSEP
jgi:CRISPR-associated protein Cmr2